MSTKISLVFPEMIISAAQSPQMNFCYAEMTLHLTASLSMRLDDCCVLFESNSDREILHNTEHDTDIPLKVDMAD